MSEPHFHKDYKVSEKDLIPDDMVYSDFPASAEEGKRIVVENPANTFTFYQYLKGSWREVGAQASTVTELGSTTLAIAASSISVASLATKEFLEIVVDIPAALSLADTILLRFNNDSGAANYASNVNIQNAGNLYSNDSKIYLDDGSSLNARSFFIKVHNRSGYNKRCSFQGSRSNGAASLVAIDGSGIWSNAVDAINRVDILTGGNNFPVNSKVTVYGI